MRVVIIRHAEVDFCWSRWCSSEMFDSECRKYDLSPIKNVTYSIPQTVYQKIYVSKLSRSKDTAKILFPNAYLVAGDEKSGIQDDGIFCKV